MSTELQRFYEKHRAPFLRWAKRRFGISTADAEDVYQESVTAYALRQGADGVPDLDCKPSTFLYAIGRNQSLKLIRSNRSTDRLADSDGTELLQEAPAVELLHDADHARAVVREGLARLTERQREVLRLYYYEGRSMQEIAERMGYNNADVAKKMKYEGLKKLSATILRIIVILCSSHAI